MPIYKGTTELTKCADWLTATEHDITEVYFGDKQVFTVWGEYDGTLPAQYSANGSTLADYRVYGSVGGVGDRTVNLFDKNATDISKGYINNGYIDSTGSAIGQALYRVTEYIKIAGGETYTLKDMNINANLASVCFYTANSAAAYISGIAYNFRSEITFETPANAEYLRFSFLAANSDIAMLTEGSTAPAEYVPYGYDVPISVSDGTTSTTTSIYIGDTPLDEDEYVSFKEQKRIRFVPITSLSKAPYQSPATIVFLTPAKDSFIVQSGSTQMTYESIDISPRVQGRVRFRCLINVEKFSSYGRILVGIRRENHTFVDGTRVETLGKTYVDIDINEIPENSYISILATSSTTNAGTYKYTVLGAEILTSTPTDPPVPLPALPTVDGTNVVDYAGQSAVPARFVAKYRKEDY